MIVFILRRLLRIAVSLVLVSIITFVLLQAAPGNFADISRLTQAGPNGASLESSVGALQSRYGASVPGWKQYLKFMQGAVTGNMGPSFQYPQLTVQGIIEKAFPISLTLATLAVVLALLIAVPLGIIAALRRNSALDYGTMFGVTALHSMPSYLLAIILILIFSVSVHALPSSGWNGPQNLILPVAALGLSSAAVLARYVRSSMIETLRAEYVVAAYARGGRERTVVVRHALRNSLIPLVTVTGPLLAVLMTGTLFIETVFEIPGLGQYFAGAARARDMPLLMGSTLFFAVILMGMNLVVDIVYGLLDPRIRAEGEWSQWRRRRRASPVQV